MMNNTNSQGMRRKISTNLKTMSSDVSTYDIELLLNRPIPLKQVRVRFNRQDFDAKLPSLKSNRELILKEWNTRLESNPSLYNGKKFRLAKVTQLSDSTVELGIGLSDYASYLGTNRNTEPDFIHLLLEEGFQNYQDRKALFANVFGNAALILTKDDCIPFVKRSSKTAEFAGWYDLPGGHPEPSRVNEDMTVFDNNSDLKLEDSIRNEIFFSILDEVHCELNIPLEKLGEPLLMGIESAHSSYGKPSAIL